MLNFEVPNTAMRSEVHRLLGGDAGVEQTVRAMCRLIDEGKKDPLIHEAAANIIRNARVPAFDWAGEVEAIGEWVGRNVRFTRDVYGKETLHSAREIIRLGIGDCDDFTILICSLLGTIGVRTRIVTISSPNMDPKQFTHVFPEAEIEGHGWVPVDYARRSPRFGMGPQVYSRRRVWSTADASFTDVQGLNGLGDNSAQPIRRGIPIARRAPRIPRANRAGLAGALGPQGFLPNALPGAYSSTIPDPQFRRLRSSPFYGVGHYGMGKVQRVMRKAAAGMGDDATDIASLIQAGAAGATNIIAAERASPYNLQPNTSYTSQGLPILSPGILPGSQSLVAGGLSSSTVLLGVGLIAVVLIAGGRGKS